MALFVLHRRQYLLDLALELVEEAIEQAVHLGLYVSLLAFAQRVHHRVHQAGLCRGQREHRERMTPLVNDELASKKSKSKTKLKC